MDTPLAPNEHPCECGCGMPTTIAKVSSVKRGWVKGQPIRFVRFHYSTTSQARDSLRQKRMYWNNPNWKGQQIKLLTGNDRANRWFRVGKCEDCDAPGKDRHHKDGNKRNNDPSNIAILCRRCHMKRDGRLARLAQLKDSLAWTRLPLQPCRLCGKNKVDRIRISDSSADFLCRRHHMEADGRLLKLIQRRRASKREFCMRGHRFIRRGNRNACNACVRINHAQRKAAQRASMLSVLENL